MNTLNSKTNEFNRFIYQLTDKLNLRNPNKNMALVNLGIYYTWENIKSEYNNKKFKISVSTWNEIITLDDRSYNIEQIQNYFEYVIKKQKTITNTGKPTAQIYVNKIKNRIVFQVKTGYKLELLTEETMQLLGKRLLVKIKMVKLCQD